MAVCPCPALASVELGSPAVFVCCDALVLGPFGTMPTFAGALVPTLVLAAPVVRGFFVDPQPLATDATRKSRQISRRAGARMPVRYRSLVG